MESQVEAFLNKKTERKFPPNPEEERRKNNFPEICSESCPHHQCPYHNEEHFGLPCEQQWQAKSNTKMKPTSKHNPNEDLLRMIEKGLEKALKPLEGINRRITDIEQEILNEADYHSPAYSTNIKPFNGSTIRFCRGTNQERINYD